MEEDKILENEITLLEESNNKYLRLLAEFENYKKRVIKEKEEIKNNTKYSMLSSILDMDSDISIAISNIKNEEARLGVELISNKLTSYLKSQGIESIQTNEYDQDIHEVISVLDSGKNISEVISKGYTLDNKIIRYPKVILGK